MRGPHFLPDGQYDLSTAEKRVLACYSMLRGIAVVPQAYGSQGAEVCRDEMARRANLLIAALEEQERREGAGGRQPQRCDECDSHFCAGDCD